ncbi:hypothetical protein NVP3058O_014 [Vibrio phage 3.058.O._10N.286.46.B8]|uniref:hypothetical protein n=1 Tax=Vibrio phage henriette 12B8 TaxID=573174 RepID=UPI0002C07C1A|nr:hypothetical protein VPDG_00128 [Vibrio phage henriette 12B8]AGG58289.1 hypothetical protein VPDG_00128 [Vibrio phage henriette 12B8]AUS01932.1 hypothetical protein NVP2058O_015 [Vibrio phage 2.058.O._10N.286.46.B8]AUS03084.1 hypothetical protein NVP3058O_014 [Vibrio phage 3.058.O._10N.286.46.B8]
MQLAIAWGRPLHEIENLPLSTITEFKALNLISPFTSDAQAYREGLIATLLYNKGCSKKSQTKTVSDLFPYLSSDTPEFLEDEKVLKAERILRTIALQRASPELYESSLTEFKTKVGEEIELLMAEKVPDMYVIRKLKKLIGDEDGKDV